MFKKSVEDDADPAARPAAPAPAAGRKSVSVIGPTLVFKGELSADEDLVIQGSIEGTIAHHKKNLTVGREGRVRADIHAAAVIIEGKVEGDIHGDEVVELANTAIVNGNIFCPRIRMADGARFTGSIDMGSATRLAVADEPSQSQKIGA